MSLLDYWETSADDERTSLEWVALALCLVALGVAGVAL